jgi:hypothetical protein
VVAVGIGDVGDGIETDVWASAFAFGVVSPLESEPQPVAIARSPATESASPARVSSVTPMSA